LTALAVAGCADMGPPGDTEPHVTAPGTFYGIFSAQTTLASGTNGSRILLMFPGGPAEASGLREGDVITLAGGIPVSSDADLFRSLSGKRPGDVLPVGVVRDGQPLTIDVKLQARPPDYMPHFLQAAVERLHAEDQAAAEAEEAGNYRAAFDHRVVAARLIPTVRSALPDPTGQFDSELARISALLPRLDSPPAVPPAVEADENRAVGMLRAARSDFDNDAAADMFGWAIHEAPWVADLYRNEGMIEAKAGNARAAVIDLNRYLILDPGAPDAPSIRQKIADLEPLAAEQTPWQRFVGAKLMTGQSERVSLRGRTLVLAVVTPPAPPDPESALKPGDTLCSGTISGTRFHGQCRFLDADPRFANCFGDNKTFPAEGAIEGGTFRIRTVTYIYFHSHSCVIDTTKESVFRTITE
jgi:hypothetical protein